jgi:GT2 family glycosyltransferase
LPPYFSIVVPTRNRPQQLNACLKTITGLEYPRDRFEVIVVNDGGTEPQKSAVEWRRDGIKATFVTQTHAGPARARNRGAEQAEGSFIAFTDDDCLPAPDFLRRLEAALTANPDSLVGGRTVNALIDNPYSAASQLLIHYLYEYYNGPAGQPRFFASNNMALSAERFQAVGGFDTTYIRATAEDREFCDRWLFRGYRMHYDPRVMVYHAHALNLGRFWRQHFTYGRGALHFHRARANRGSQRLSIEPPSFYARLLMYPFTATSGRMGLALGALLLVSQVASAAGFTWEAVSRDRPGKSAKVKVRPVRAEHE